MASTSSLLILKRIHNQSANSRRQRLKESAAVESLSARRNRRMDAKEKGEMTMQKRTAASDLARSFNARTGRLLGLVGSAAAAVAVGGHYGALTAAAAREGALYV